MVSHGGANFWPGGDLTMVEEVVTSQRVNAKGCVFYNTFFMLRSVKFEEIFRKKRL